MQSIKSYIVPVPRTKHDNTSNNDDNGKYNYDYADNDEHDDNDYNHDKSGGAVYLGVEYGLEKLENSFHRINIFHRVP